MMHRIPSWHCEKISHTALALLEECWENLNFVFQDSPTHTVRWKGKNALFRIVLVTLDCAHVLIAIILMGMEIFLMKRFHICRCNTMYTTSMYSLVWLRENIVTAFYSSKYNQGRYMNVWNTVQFCEMCGK